jgi:ribulose-phosphate 3-epimerase
MAEKIMELLEKLKPALSVGVISADLMALGNDITELQANGIQLLHFDVMDGHFVPALTFGPVFVKAVKTKMLKDVHLMIDDPFDAIGQYAAAGADIITVHTEASIHARAALQCIGNQTNTNDLARGIARGIAINPGTPLCNVKPLLEEADVVTLVAINPGFPGQKLCADTAKRVDQLREMIAKTGRKILVCIDGGVTKGNIAEVSKMKPDIVVTGSAIFEEREIKINIEKMIKALKS